MYLRMDSGYETVRNVKFDQIKRGRIKDNRSSS